MIDFVCGYIEKGKPSNCAFSKLNLGRTILLCSVVRPVDEFSITYVEYLNKIFKKYKSKLDTLAIIDGYNENWIHPTYNCRFPNITTLTDQKLELVNYLKKKYKKHETIDYLNQFWSYQILIKDMQIKNFYYQPLDTKINEFMANENVKAFFRREGLGSQELIKLYKAVKHKDPGFFNPIYASDYLLPNKGYQPKLRQLGRYYNIWPNTILEHDIKNLID